MSATKSWEAFAAHRGLQKDIAVQLTQRWWEHATRENRGGSPSHIVLDSSTREHLYIVFTDHLDAAFREHMQQLRRQLLDRMPWASLIVICRHLQSKSAFKATMKEYVDLNITIFPSNLFWCATGQLDGYERIRAPPTGSAVEYAKRVSEYTLVQSDKATECLPRWFNTDAANAFLGCRAGDLLAVRRPDGKKLLHLVVNSDVGTWF